MGRTLLPGTYYPQTARPQVRPGPSTGQPQRDTSARLPGGTLEDTKLNMGGQGLSGSEDTDAFGAFPCRKRKPRGWSPSTENLQRYFLTAHRGGLSSSKTPARPRLSGFGKEKAKPSAPRADLWPHTHSAVTAAPVGPGASGPPRQSTACVATAARAQTASPLPQPRSGWGPGLAVTAGRGCPPLPSPSPRSPPSSTPRSGLASRAPRGPPGRPQNRPGRATPAPERPLHRSRDAAVVLPPRKQLPRGARPGTSPPRPASGGRG